MKKLYLLLTFLTIFVLAVVSLLAGCSLLGGLGGNDDNKPIDSDAVRYLHFVKEGDIILMNYKVDRYYSQESLQDALDRIVSNYRVPKNGKYLDGTAFSANKDDLNNYIVNHKSDTFVDIYPAYTVVMEMVPITHSLDYYVDGELYRHYDLTFDEWNSFEAPSVPKKDGYVGVWDHRQTEFTDSRIDAVYKEAFYIASASDWKNLWNYKDSYFLLKNDIDFNGEAIPEISSFNGYLDGQGYKVYNFANQNLACNVIYGLISVNNGTITDIVFSDGSFVINAADTTTDTQIGFLTGVNNGTITNVRVEDVEIQLTGNHSTRWLSSIPHEVEGNVNAGVIAGTNNNEISYVTVTNSVNVSMTTKIFGRKNDSFPNAKLTTWSNHGLIAGCNKGQVNHATTEANLISSASMTITKVNLQDSNFGFVYFYHKVGGIVGSNIMGAFVKDCFSAAKVEANHDAVANVSGEYAVTVDVGGIAGANSGFVNKCGVGASAVIRSYCYAETRMGGVIGFNDGSVSACYSLAQFVINNRSALETYCGGAVGYNDGTLTYSYAVVSNVRLGAVTNTENAYLGGLFGYASFHASTNHCFVTVDTAGVLNNYAFGFYSTTTIDSYCYVHLTDSATNYLPCDKVTVCASAHDLFDAIADKGFEAMGFVLSADTYPTLPNIGNIK